MTAPGPQPMKPASRQGATAAASARFVLAEAAPAGAVVDLDLNTGMLVVAATTDQGLPSQPPPALYLRAVVADLHAQGGAYAAVADWGTAAAFGAAAAQVAHVLDTLGVATEPQREPHPHTPLGKPDETGTDTCLPCGTTIQLHDGRWYDPEGNWSDCPGWGHWAVPLDAFEDTWRCGGCGRTFICATGWARCPAVTEQ